MRFGRWFLKWFMVGVLIVGCFVLALQALAWHRGYGVEAEVDQSWQSEIHQIEERGWADREAQEKAAWGDGPAGTWAARAHEDAPSRAGKVPPRASDTPAPAGIPGTGHDVRGEASAFLPNAGP